MRRARLPLLAFLVLAMLAEGVGIAAQPRAGSKFRPAVSGRLGVITTESPAAARVGRAVLERGGNAVDAAAATVFALNVARPQSCGIGGGGFLVYRSARGRTASLDFREAAPAAFTPHVFDHPGLAQDFTGHLTHGVPGTVSGMDAALRRFGTFSLARAVAPAERLARVGVRVTPALHAAMVENTKRLKLFPYASAQFLVGGHRAYRAGTVLRQPALARTLDRIRRQGTRGFYRGLTAAYIVQDERRARRLKGDRGVLTVRDLARYRAKWRAPLRGSFRGANLVAMPPPSSGGVAIVEMLNLLEPYDLAGFGPRSADTLHLVAEAQKIAWADRSRYLGDPGFARVPTRTLTSKAYADRRRGDISLARARRYRPGAVERRGGSTTHVSVIDRHGNAVSVTCTIEQEFGSAVVVPGAGFLMNNEMTDFGDPGTANEPRAFKRPRSSMSPIIAVRGGKPIAVTGGAGGSTIIMGTFWTLLDRLELGQDLAHAVDGPRIDAQLEQTDRGGKLLIEDGRIPARVLAELRRRGHRLEREGEYADLPRVQAAGFRSPRSAVKDALSDPRTEEGSLAQRRYPGPVPCGIKGGRVLRETRTGAIVITGGDRGGDYLGCWKASGRRTALYEQGLRIGNQYTFLGYPTIAGPRAALVESTIITVETNYGPSVSIVDADLRSGRVHRLDSPRGDNGLDVSAFALNRCGTLAYASTIRNNLFDNRGHAPDIRVWRGQGAPARVGAGPVDRRSLRLTPRYVQWRNAGRRHQARIPGAACR